MRSAGACALSTKKNMGWGPGPGSYGPCSRTHHTTERGDVPAVLPAPPPAGPHPLRARGGGRRLRLRPGPRPGHGGLRVPADAVVVGCVASVQPRKNQVLLAEALPDREVPSSWQARCLTRLPRPWRSWRSPRQRGVEDRVHLTGELDDVRPVLAASDVFALASRAEGHPSPSSRRWPPGSRCWPPPSPASTNCSPDRTPPCWWTPTTGRGPPLPWPPCARTPPAGTPWVRPPEPLVRARRSIDLEVAHTESLYLELLWTLGSSPALKRANPPLERAIPARRPVPVLRIHRPGQGPHPRARR